MRIAIVVDNLNPNVGWGRLALKVAQGLKERGNEIGFIVEKAPADLSDPCLKVHLRTSSRKKVLRFPITLWKIRKFINNYDVVLCYDVNPNAIVLNLANLWQKRKIVIHALATYSLLGRGTVFRNFFMRWAYRRAKKVLVVSEFTKREIIRSGYNPKRALIVPVGVDVDFFRPIKSDERILGDRFILTVGEVKPRKGYHLSIPAFKLITDEFPDLKHVIIGYQSMVSYVNEIKNMVAKLGLRDRVIFLQNISDEDILKYYNDAELFLMTSTTDPDSIEGFGMVYLEAGACGTPVVGAYNTGAEAAILDNVNGLLVNHEPGDIARAMRKILSDKDVADRMGQEGIKRAQEFSWSRVADLYSKYL